MISMANKRKLIAFNVGGTRAKGFNDVNQKKIFDFLKTLNGSDLGAFFIYEEGFLEKHINITVRLK